MRSELHLPIFGLRKKEVTTNELIFKLLTSSYPKTVAALTEEIRTRFKQKLTYQAIRKSVLTLSDLGVIVHENGGYQISVDWLLSARAAIDDTLDRYRSTSGASFDLSLEYQRFFANSLYEADTLWGDLLLSICKNIPKAERGKIVSINHYPWWIPINAGREAELFARLVALGFKIIFVFTKGGIHFEQAKAFYKNIKVSVLLRKGLKISESHQYNIIGDRIIEAVIPKHLENRITQTFKGSAANIQIGSRSLLRLVNEKAEIKLTVQRNEAFAKGLLDAVGEARTFNP